MRFSRTCPRACIQAPALNYLHGEAHSLRIPSSKEIRFQPIKSAPSLISHINLLKSLTHSFIPSRRFLQRACLQTPARITRLENHIAPPRARARARARAGLGSGRKTRNSTEVPVSQTSSAHGKDGKAEPELKTRLRISLRLERSEAGSGCCFRSSGPFNPKAPGGQP